MKKSDKKKKKLLRKGEKTLQKYAEIKRNDKKYLFQEALDLFG